MTEQTGGILPAYLVVGDDDLKRQTVMKRLRMRLEEAGDLSFNLDEFTGESADADALLNACATIPFASEKRLVIVTNAEKLKKDAQERIATYLSDPVPTTVLMLVATSLAKNTKLYKACAKIGPTAIIDCAMPKRDKLERMVRDMAPAHGATISAQAAKRLVELVGEDTVHIDKELEKLATAHSGNAPISVEEVEDQVAGISEPKPWEFTDAFSARDLARCIALKRKMPSVSSHALLGMCTNRLRELICARTMSDAGSRSTTALAEQIGTVDWKVKNHFSYAQRFEADELISALCASADTERQMKSGADADTAFMDWVVSVLKRAR